MSQQDFIEWCCDKVFYVAISRLEIGDFLSRKKGFMSQQSLAKPGVFFRDRMFFCHDRARNGREILCCDKILYVATKCCQG